MSSTALKLHAPALALLLAACSSPNPAYDGGDGSQSAGGTASEEPQQGSTSTGSSDSVADGSGSAEGSGSPVGPCATDNGGCDPNATCAPSDDDDEVECVCTEGFMGNGFECEPPLESLRIDLPCLAVEGCEGDDICAMLDDERSIELPGDPETLYDVTLRVRGVVELNSYRSGTSHGWYYEGGEPNTGQSNVFRLEGEDPPNHWFLNDGGGELYCFGIDQELEIRARGGSTLSLSANTMDDCGLENLDDSGMAIVVPEIHPAPMAFHGQFVQIDVVELTPSE